MNRHDLENELQGTQMILMAMLLETGKHEFLVEAEKLLAAEDYRLDSREVPGGDVLFLVKKEN